MSGTAQPLPKFYRPRSEFYGVDGLRPYLDFLIIRPDNTVVCCYANVIYQGVRRAAPNDHIFWFSRGEENTPIDVHLGLLRMYHHEDIRHSIWVQEWPVAGQSE